MIEARNLAKVYDSHHTHVTAIRDLNFSMARGDYVSLMGESGAGKSTLLKLLGCLDRPTAGTYQFDDVNVAEMDDAALAAVRNRKIGFIFQSSYFVDYLNIVDNVALACMYSSPYKPGRERAETLLKRVGLGHRLHHLPAELSGGERQRAATARALYASPQLLLADEPTGNLDRASADRITQLFEDLNQEGYTILLVTHDPVVAARATRHCEIIDGVIHQ